MFVNGGVYYLPFTHINDGNAADTFQTMAAGIVAAAETALVQLLGFNIAACTGAYSDEAFEVKVNRINDVSAGGAGTKTAITAANMPRQWSGMGDPSFTGGVLYTVEPTAYETNAIYHDVSNDRGRISHFWPEGTGPIMSDDQLIGLLMAPRFAGPTQGQWSGTMYWRAMPT